MQAKTIQIFLPDGNPRSIKIVEITSRTVQAILIPRSKLEFAFERNEIKNVGIYFLIGSDEDGSKPLLYIGEAEDCQVRIKQHNKQKDFWTNAIIFISKTQYFTKTHIKYLEYLSYIEAEKTKRFSLENSSIPTKPYISESMEAGLQDNFDTIKILISTLGFPVFDEFKKPTKKDILECKGKDAVARGEYNEEGLVVFEGSKCNLEETPTAGQWIIGMRNRLKIDKVLIQEKNTLVFTSNYLFNSPSAAAGVVLARRANGWIEWKYENGKTLDEEKRQKV